MPLVFGGPGIALPKTLGKIVSAQDAAASGCLFFKRRDSDTKPCLAFNQTKSYN